MMARQLWFIFLFALSSLEGASISVVLPLSIERRYGSSLGEIVVSLVAKHVPNEVVDDSNLVIRFLGSDWTPDDAMLKAGTIPLDPRVYVTELDATNYPVAITIEIDQNRMLVLTFDRSGFKSSVLRTAAGAAVREQGAGAMKKMPNKSARANAHRPSFSAHDNRA